MAWGLRAWPALRPIRTTRLQNPAGTEARLMKRHIHARCQTNRARSPASGQGDSIHSGQMAPFDTLCRHVRCPGSPPGLFPGSALQQHATTGSVTADRCCKPTTEAAQRRERHSAPLSAVGPDVSPPFPSVVPGLVPGNQGAAVCERRSTGYRGQVSRRASAPDFASPRRARGLASEWPGERRTLDPRDKPGDDRGGRTVALPRRYRLGRGRPILRTRRVQGRRMNYRRSSD